MIDYANQIFDLHVPEHGSQSEAKQIEQAQKTLAALGKLPNVPQIIRAIPECPAGCEFVWNVWMELDEGRERGGMILAPLPLSYRDLLAYSQVNGIQFNDWEIQAIKSIDKAYLVVAYKRINAKMSREK